MRSSGFDSIFSSSKLSLFLSVWVSDFLKLGKLVRSSFGTTIAFFRVIFSATETSSVLLAATDILNYWRPRLTSKTAVSSELASIKFFLSAFYYFSIRNISWWSSLRYFLLSFFRNSEFRLTSLSFLLSVLLDLG